MVWELCFNPVPDIFLDELPETGKMTAFAEFPGEFREKSTLENGSPNLQLGVSGL